MADFQDYATRINLDAGIIEKLYVGQFKNILVLTGTKNSLSVFKERIAPMLRNKVHLYSGIKANPTETDIYTIANFARRKDIDCIVSVGGGAVMDSGRLVSLLLSHSGLLHEYLPGGTVGPLGITPDIIYHVTVPTVSGTGAEISASASYSKNGIKYTIISPYLAPKATYIDPELMKGIPAKTWAGIGFDCFARALEAYVSTYASQDSDAFAESALKAYIKNNTKLLDNPNDTTYIQEMIVASINSFVAANMSSLGAVHAIGEALSAKLNIHHGAALSLVCAPVCQANYKFNKPKFDLLLKIMGVKLLEKKQGIEGAVEKLITKLGIAKPAVKEKLTDEARKEIAMLSLNPTMRGNPKNFTAQEIVSLLEKI